MGDDSTAGEVVFTFDPDAAGQKAALRAFADAKRFNAQTYVATGPEGLDPCDLRLQRGDGAVRALMELKVPMVEFVIDQRISGFDLASVEGRVGALRAAAPVVAELRDPLLQPEYVRVLARRLGLDTEDVRREVERAGRGGSRRDATPRPGRARSPGIARVTIASLPRAADVALERDALMGFLQFGHRIDRDVLLRRASPCRSGIRRSTPCGRPCSPRPTSTGPGWAADAVGAVREPYRSLAAELLTADFPALTDEAAVASTADLARRLVGARARPREVGAARARSSGSPPASTEGRGHPAAPARTRRRAPAVSPPTPDARVAAGIGRPRTAG